MDLVVNPIDGRDLVAKGDPGAIAVIAVPPRGTLWAPSPATYIEKILVDADVADALVPECLDAPAAWALGLVTRSKNKAAEDLTVFVLDRPRHVDLTSETPKPGPMCCFEMRATSRVNCWPDSLTTTSTS
jgi:fructose-1,6-bisphosphatase II